MTQQEFKNLTGREVDILYFAVIHNEYMNSQLDKTAFCKQWCETHTQSETEMINALVGVMRNEKEDMIKERDWYKSGCEGLREDIRRMRAPFRSNYNFMNDTIRSLRGAVAQG